MVAYIWNIFQSTEQKANFLITSLIWPLAMIHFNSLQCRLAERVFIWAKSLSFRSQSLYLSHSSMRESLSMRKNLSFIITFLHTFLLFLALSPGDSWRTVQFVAMPLFLKNYIAYEQPWLTLVNKLGWQKTSNGKIAIPAMLQNVLEFGDCRYFSFSDHFWKQSTSAIWSK